ncbi:DUF3108 domain-containing protein [Aerophototrophica crusticola]|uniref:DUF3108 domain-containing protein n=1 Tax=Aerophototrophica crusticola TaxID=1709002 RepID=A0A858R548_9PROT|nr:DUF3108 domain-containing protein [Rhodospirillaceae bacterium B3]
MALPRTRMLFPLLTAGLLAAAPARAELGPKPGDWSLGYAVYVGGVHVLDATAHVGLGSSDYRIGLAAATEGFLGRVASWKADVASHGVLEPGAAGPLRPNLFRSHGAWQDKPRNTVVEYTADGLPKVTVADPRRRRTGNPCRRTSAPTRWTPCPPWSWCCRRWHRGRAARPRCPSMTAASAMTCPSRPRGRRTSPSRTCPSSPVRRRPAGSTSSPWPAAGRRTAPAATGMRKGAAATPATSPSGSPRPRPTARRCPCAWKAIPPGQGGGPPVQAGAGGRGKTGGGQVGRISGQRPRNPTARRDLRIRKFGFAGVGLRVCDANPTYEAANLSNASGNSSNRSMMMSVPSSDRGMRG